MKISHEVPLCFLKDSLEWNDYQYVLPHLMDLYPQYKEHMLEYRKTPNSFIIMDNGLFEGVTHTTEDLLDKINLIKPNIFIVPDAWNDSTSTLVNAKKWMNIHKPNLPEGVNLMAVCQGKTLSELISTYNNLINLGYRHIAINHSSVAYQEMYPDLKPLHSQMYGRIKFIRTLLQEELLDKTVYHHILGASLPQEYMAHADWTFIKSGDTSNPILVGAEGVRYGDNGIDWKPKEKLEFYLEKDLTLAKEDIIFNVNKFKTFVKNG